MATPVNKEKFKNQAQTRALTMMPREDGGVKRLVTDFYVEGYAATYRKYLLYEIGRIKVYERFDPGCFKNTDMSDIIMQFDHAGRVFARTTNKTLIVEADENGLFVAADLEKTQDARSLYDDIKSEMITKMSWRFKVGDYDIEHIDGSDDITIVHKSIPKIYDVSAVSIPANDDTQINARTWVDGVIDTVARREAEREIRIRKTKLKIKLTEELK